MRTAEQIASLMATYAVSPREQGKQTAYRMQLAETWAIAPGARVLEIGCGQGDTTAVLAEIVGPKGRVTGIDPAPADYGAPVSLGDSARHFQGGPYGDVIDIRLDFTDWSKLAGDYDVAVLAHCAWYFSGYEVLVETLKQARARARTLCIAEWSLHPVRPAQIPHYFAVTLQQLVSKFHPELELNIQNPFSEAQIVGALAAAGWHIESRHLVEQPDVDDGRWEVEELLRLAARSDLSLPSELQAWLLDQAATIRGYGPDYASLPAVSFICR